MSSGVPRGSRRRATSHGYRRRPSRTIRIIGAAEVRAALALLDSERQQADLHFDAWRATTISVIENKFELRIPVADLPASVDGLAISDPAAAQTTGIPTDVRDLWRRFEIGLIGAWDAPRQVHAQAVDTNPSSKILARRADSLTLRLIQGHEDKTVLDVTTHLVVDEFSKLEAFDISENIFHDNNLEVTFDAEGMLVGVSASGTSALAGALGAVAAVPGAFASGAESVKKVQESIDGRRASADAERARLQGDIKLRQERILRAGLGITQDDLVDLKGLQRARSVLDAQSKVSGADPVLVTELAAHAGGSWGRASLPSALEIRIDGAAPASDGATPSSNDDTQTQGAGGQGGDASKGTAKPVVL
jgi:hypothetical protein